MQEKNSKSVNILDRIKEFYNLKTDKSLSDFLNVSQPVISNWRTRNSIDYGLIIDKCSDMDMNWLLYGIEPVENKPKEVEKVEKVEKLEKRVVELEEEIKKMMPILILYKAKLQRLIKIQTVWTLKLKDFVVKTATYGDY